MKYILSNRMRKMFSLLTVLLLIFSISLSSISTSSYADDDSIKFPIIIKKCVIKSGSLEFIVCSTGEIIVQDVMTKKQYKMHDFLMKIDNDEILMHEISLERIGSIIIIRDSLNRYLISAIFDINLGYYKKLELPESNTSRSTPSSVIGSNKPESNASSSTSSSVITLDGVENGSNGTTKETDSPVRKNFISRCRECVSGCYSCVPLVSCMASCKYCKCCSSIREKISSCFRACTSRCLGLKKKSETVKTGSETKDSDKSDINTAADTVLLPKES